MWPKATAASFLEFKFSGDFMPTETLIVLAGVVAAFVIFGVTLGWVEWRTRGIHRS
jgi:hypothetical protein